MALLDVSQDYTVFDGIETVSYVVIDNGSVTSTTSVAGALRRPIGKGVEVLTAAGYVVAPNDMKFHLPADNMSGLTPKDGDRITASDGSFQVYATSLESHDGNSTLGTRWACMCRQERS